MTSSSVTTSSDFKIRSSSPRKKPWGSFLRSKTSSTPTSRNRTPLRSEVLRRAIQSSFSSVIPLKKNTTSQWTKKVLPTFSSSSTILQRQSKSSSLRGGTPKKTSHIVVSSQQLKSAHTMIPPKANISVIQGNHAMGPPHPKKNKSLGNPLRSGEHRGNSHPRSMRAHVKQSLDGRVKKRSHSTSILQKNRFSLQNGCFEERLDVFLQQHIP